MQAATGNRGLQLSAPALVRWLAAAAMASSAIVFSEPAPVDALMLAFAVALFVLGRGRVGSVAASGLVVWLAITACGLGATYLSPDFGDAVRFQLITLYLAFAAFALSAFIAEDPDKNFHIVAIAYLAGALIAAAAGIAGYFKLTPEAYELFTNYGRARGTFKDPNVFGAALAPALCYLTWVVLREPRRLGRIGLPALGLIALAILLSFSRGAWISAATSLALLGWLLAASARRRRDRTRLVTMSLTATLATLLVVGVALQNDQIHELFGERASLTQSYDEGPEGRFGGQAKAIGLLAEHPFGIGTHTFRTVHHHEEAHNVYLTTFLNAGWPGGLLYIVVVVMTLAVGFSRLINWGRLQGPFAVATAAFLGLAVEGFIIDSDHWRHFFIVMAMVWGLADAAPVEADASRRAGD